MADPLKLISNEAKPDDLVSYTTDLLPVIDQHQGWFAEHHREGAAFPAGAQAGCSLLLEAGEDSAREQGEALAATREQTEIIGQATQLIREVQRRARYISTELRRDPAPEAQAQARKVELAAGIGLRINFDRQTGLRKLLATQQQGLTEIEPIMKQYKQPADLVAQLGQTKEELEQSIRKQSKEALEAALALDERDRRCAVAMDWVNRILRLVNVEWDQAPPLLRTSLLTLQGDHPGVFWSKSGKGQTADPTELAASQPLAAAVRTEGAPGA